MLCTKLLKAALASLRALNSTKANPLKKLSSQQDQLGAVSEPVVSGASHLSGKSNGRELAEGFEYCGYFLFSRLKKRRFIDWVRPLNCHLEGYVSN